MRNVVHGAVGPDPVYVRLRAMKGRGSRVMPLDLREGDVVRVDGMKYRVQSEPEQHVTGSVVVHVYSADNQFDALYLSAKSLNVRKIGELP